MQVETEEAYEDRISRLLEIQHEPINMPRKACIGEHVFYEEWKAIMTKGLNGMDYETIYLERILSDMPTAICQRHATVCASFVRWLGTNCGRGFLYDAKRFAEDTLFRSRGRAFLAYWSLENYRKRAINNGTRITEHVLKHYELGYTELHPEPSANDYEVIEHLVFWLGSSEGESFLHGCIAKIEEINTIESTIKRINSEAELLNRKKAALFQVALFEPQGEA